MIFRTIKDDITGANKSIGLFGKSLSDFKRVFQSLIKNGIRNTFMLNFDTKAINQYNDAIKSGCSFEEALNEARKSTNLDTLTLINSSHGLEIQIDKITAAQKKSILAAKAQSAAFQVLSFAGNIAASIGISKLIEGIYHLTQVSKHVAQKAQEVGSSFSSASSSINDYKTKILELSNTIHDSRSSIHEVTNARKSLLDIQDELIAKFGQEEEAVHHITNAIQGQTDALDHLTNTSWQNSLNDFNDGTWSNDFSNFLKGYSDNVQRMEEEYGTYSAKIDPYLFKGFDPKNQSNYKAFIAVLEEQFGATPAFDSLGNPTPFLEISGTATQVHQKLLAIQELANDFNFNNNFANHLTKLANAAREVSDQYKEFWNQYIL